MTSLHRTAPFLTEDSELLPACIRGWKRSPWPPRDILFLQNRLSGLAGYILVRHVREATGAGVTKIILLTEGTQGSENSTADIELLTGVSGNELSDAISEIIGDQLGAPTIAPAPDQVISAIAVTNPSPLDPEIADTVSFSQSPLPVVRNPQISPQSASQQIAPVEDLSAPAMVVHSNPPPHSMGKKTFGVCSYRTDPASGNRVARNLFPQANSCKTCQKRST